MVSTVLKLVMGLVLVTSTALAESKEKFVIDDKKIDMVALYENAEQIKVHDREVTDYTLLIVSATWCGPCRRFAEEANEFQKKNLVNIVIFNTSSSNRDMVLEKAKKAEYDVLFANEGIASDQLDSITTYFPTAILVNSKSEIVYKGYTTTVEEKLAELRKLDLEKAKDESSQPVAQ